MIKFYNVTTNETFNFVIWGSIIIITINILLVIILFWLNARKMEKAVVPILRGIETISQGKAVSLPEKGELSEISAVVNRTGQILLKKDKARAEWINGVSHDIRTPLSIIMGYSGEIEDNNLVPQATRESAKIICRQGEKLRSLIADLNLTSKLEYSMQPLKLDTIVPAELARQIISDFLNNGLEARYIIDFDSSEDADTISLKGDQSLLIRMLRNLIQNSISHNPDGCHITVIVRKVRERCEFVIWDDGVGISDNQMKRFHAGIYSDEDYGENGETAHGFGLRLVYQIVHAHNGDICFEASNPTGLLIRIYL